MEMMLVGDFVTHGVGANFVHMVVASVMAWGFVAGTVATHGVILIRKGREREA